MNVNDGIVLVIGELRGLVVERDNKIAELVKRNSDLSLEISRASSQLHEVLDANRNLAEQIRVYEANMNNAKSEDKRCQQITVNQN